MLLQPAFQNRNTLKKMMMSAGDCNHELEQRWTEHCLEKSKDNIPERQTAFVYFSQLQDMLLNNSRVFSVTRGEGTSRMKTPDFWFLETAWRAAIPLSLLREHLAEHQATFLKASLDDDRVPKLISYSAETNQ